MKTFKQIIKHPKVRVITGFLLILIYIVQLNIKIDNLKEHITEERIKNNTEIIKKIEELSGQRNDTVKYYTKEINKYYQKNDSASKEIDRIISVDSLIDKYYELRPEW